MSCMRDVFPESMWESISPQLYATFWSLSLYDIEVPVDRYRAETAKLRESLKVLADDIARDPSAGGPVKVHLDLLSVHCRWHSAYFQYVMVNSKKNAKGFSEYYKSSRRTLRNRRQTTKWSCVA